MALAPLTSMYIVQAAYLWNQRSAVVEMLSRLTLGGRSGQRWCDVRARTAAEDEL